MHLNKPILFTKMHGLGNDFVVIDGISQPLKLTNAHIKYLADRHLGIGCDQLLLIETSQQANFACRIFNSDGSEAEQCGNGLRCVARFLADKNLTNQQAFTIETKAGVFNAQLCDNDLIEITMGTPCFAPELIPFVAETTQPTYALQLDNPSMTLEMSVLSMGNPHAILIVDSINNSPVQQIGGQVASHPAFPLSTNVGFMEIVNRQQIRLRTFERGTGETFACGSNACAAVVAGISSGSLDHKVQVNLPYGDLYIEWQGSNNPVKMTGPATTVFEGTIKLDK